MTIITVAQQKGGVGRTTLSVCLAGELSRRNYDVALVDGDAQRSSSHWAAPGNLEFPVYEINLENVSIGSWASDVKKISADFVVIDTAPNERHLGASIALADIVLVPCTASGLDLEATGRTMSIVRAVRSRRHAPMAVVLVPNRIDLRTLEGQQLEEELRGFGECVAPAISSRTAFLRAFTSGESVATSTAGGAADRDIQALCDVVQRELKKIRR